MAIVTIPSVWGSVRTLGAHFCLCLRVGLFFVDADALPKGLLGGSLDNKIFLISHFCYFINLVSKTIQRCYNIPLSVFVWLNV